MKLNRKTEQLLHNLREAIDAALADSSNILAAMSELEDAGFSPSLSVNIALPEKVEPPSLELVTFDEGLVLTASDESFLRNLGIARQIVWNRPWSDRGPPGQGRTATEALARASHCPPSSVYRLAVDDRPDWSESGSVSVTRSSLPMVLVMCPLPVVSSTRSMCPGPREIFFPPATSTSPRPLRVITYWRRGAVCQS
jgi:hypothetical protein